uniref:Secreted protein n=1 Tax=Panagrellus redivivus TaxID=6233 RepID=A0A7E4UXM5_PANRE
MAAASQHKVLVTVWLSCECRVHVSAFIAYEYCIIDRNAHIQKDLIYFYHNPSPSGLPREVVTMNRQAIIITAQLTI